MSADKDKIKTVLFIEDHWSFKIKEHWQSLTGEKYFKNMIIHLIKF